MSDKPPARFDNFQKRAEGMLGSPERLHKLVGQGVNKLASASGGKFAELRRQLTLCIALLRAWLAGDYRQVSQKTVVVMVAALLYFVVPLDVIPDFIFGWGLLDDMAVLTYVFAQFSEEVTAFEQWQLANQTPAQGQQNDPSRACGQTDKLEQAGD